MLPSRLMVYFCLACWLYMNQGYDGVLLAANPGLAPKAVEEVLRYDPPVHLVTRVAGEDFSVGGATVPSGFIVLLLLAAASRDPAVNEEPDRFDIARTQPRHLAFGFGAHFCLGAPLARLEAQVALAAFTRRFPRRGPPSQTCATGTTSPCAG